MVGPMPSLNSGAKSHEVNVRKTLAKQLATTACLAIDPSASRIRTPVYHGFHAAQDLARVSKSQYEELGPWL